MTLTADLQILTQPGSTGNQTYSCTDPKAVVLWAVPIAADGTAASWALGTGFGTYRGSTVQQRYATMRSLDAQASADNARGAGNDALLVLQTQSAGASSRDLTISLVSMSSTNVVLNWSNLHTTASIRVFMLVLGGSDITDALVDDFTIGTASTTQDETVVAGFGKPNLVFFQGNGGLTDDATSPMQFFGFAEQGQPGRGWGFSMVDGNTASLTGITQRSDRAILPLLTTSASATTSRAIGRLDTTVANWPTDGFRVLWDANPGNADVVGYLALRGTFQTASGSNTAPTSGSPTVNQDNSTGTTSVAYVGAGTVGTAASGNVTPTINASSASGHLMICVIESADNVASTMPAGWNSRVAQNQGTALRQQIFTKVHSGSESNPLVTHPAGNAIKARIFTYSGVNTATNDGVNTSSTAGGTGTTVTATTITPTAGSAVLFAVSESVAGDTSGADSASGYSGTDPTFTEIDDSNQLTSTNALMGALAWGINYSGAATGSRTATIGIPSTGTVNWLGTLIALTPTTFTTFTPVAALVFGWNLAATTTVQSAAADQAGFGIGAYDGTDQAWAGFTEDDAAGTMVSKSQQETDHVLANYSVANAIQSSAIASFVTTNLRLGWDDIDTVAREYQYLIIGAAAGSTSTRTVPTSAALSSTLTRTVPTSAALTGQGTRTVPTSAALSLAGNTRTAPTSAALSLVSTRTVPTSAALTGQATRTVPTSAALSSTLTRTVPTSAATSLAGNTRGVPTSAALSLVGTRTVPASAALSNLLTRPVPASAALSSVLARTVPSSAALSQLLSRTVPASSAISQALTRTVPSSVALSSVLARTVPTSAALSQPGTRTVSTSAALSQVLARAVPTSASIGEVLTRTVPTSTALTSTLTRDVPTSASIGGVLTRVVPTSAALSTLSDRTVPTSAALSSTSTRAVPTSSALSQVLTRDVPTSSALQGTGTCTVPTSVSLVLPGSLNRSVPTSAALTGQAQRVAPTSAALSQLTSCAVPTSAALSQAATRTAPTSVALFSTVQRSVPTSAALSSMQARTVPASAAVSQENSRTAPTSASIGQVVQVDVPTSAAISQVVTVTVPTSAALEQGTVRVVPTSAALTGTSQITVPTSASLTSLDEPYDLLVIGHYRSGHVVGLQRDGTVTANPRDSGFAGVPRRGTIIGWGRTTTVRGR